MSVYSDSTSNRIPIFATSSVVLCIWVGLTINIVQKAYYFIKLSWTNYFSDNTYWNFWHSSYIDAEYELNLYLLKENDFEALALESMYREMLVSVTLSNKKVYIGSIKTLPNFTNEREYLNLLPVLSGYRDNEQNLVINTDYIELVENYKKELEKHSNADDDFDLVIKYEHIVSINLFDPDIYEANIDKVLEKQQSDDDIASSTVINFNLDQNFLDQLKGDIDAGKF